MRTIAVFEPALCCNTGLCGADVDQTLVTFTADLAWLQQRGAQISRHNLASDPMAFAGNPTVKQFLEVAGSAGLPLVLVDGLTVLTGAYPNRDQLLTWAGLDATPAPPRAAELGLTDNSAAESCCAPGDSSCC
jgi:hypothetical protein